LALARRCYLVESYSLGDFRKFCVLALINYFEIQNKVVSYVSFHTSNKLGNIEIKERKGGGRPKERLEATSSTSYKNLLKGIIYFLLGNH
jgi:hypothetical protein